MPDVVAAGTKAVVVMDVVEEVDVVVVVAEVDMGAEEVVLVVCKKKWRDR